MNHAFGKALQITLTMMCFVRPASFAARVIHAGFVEKRSVVQKIIDARDRKRPIGIVLAEGALGDEEHYIARVSVGLCRPVIGPRLSHSHPTQHTRHFTTNYAASSEVCLPHRILLTW